MFDAWTDLGINTDFGTFMLLLALFLFLVFGLPSIINTWKLFNKAEQPGWSAIIPFYSTYIFGLISKKPMWMVWVAIGLSLVSNLPGFRESGIGALFSLALFVFYLIFLSGFVKQYDAGVGFWVLYIFFPFFALFMVNGVNYVGEEVAAAPEGQSIAAAPTTTQFNPTEAQPQIQAQPQVQPAPVATQPQPEPQAQPQTPPQDQNNQTPPQSNTPINF